MGTALLEYPVFQHTLALFNEALSQIRCEWNIFDILHGKDPIKDINSPEYSQPLCTALQVALVELLRTFGIYPSVVIGHSSGEISAAYTIGAISLASAARVAFYRGKLAASLIERGNSGSMMAVAMSKEGTRLTWKM
jgi:acyl transferase domain-containing protein